MSHFVVIVQLPKGATNKDLNKIMSPYDENRSVKPYEKECDCIWCKANKFVRHLADKKFGNVDDLRKSFAEIPNVMDIEAKMAAIGKRIEKKANESLEKEYHELSEQVNSLWQKHIHLDERDAFEKQRMKKAMKATKPDQDCEDCKGTGKVTTNYNPDSKWDYFGVGGRWDGFFGNKNTVSGKEAKKFFQENNPPFAIVTKDGQWHERGRMGWWACVSNEDDNWPEKAKALIAKFDDTDKIIAVDCHI